MARKNISNLSGDPPRAKVTKSGVNRRQMLGGLLAGAGAGLALPAAAAAARPAPGMSMPAPAPVPSSLTEPAFLDAHQRATLEAMSLRILPGTNAVETVAFIDRLLSVLPADEAQSFATGNNDPQGTVYVPAPAKQNLLDALGAFEAKSRRRFGLPFKDLSEARQIAIFEAASQPPEAAAAKPAQAEPEAPRRVTLHDHFQHVKNWVVGSYFSSEAGIRSLGWTGNVFFPSFTGCPGHNHES